MSGPVERLTTALSDRYRIERFLAEIRTTAKLQHPNIGAARATEDALATQYDVTPQGGGFLMARTLDRSRGWAGVILAQSTVSPHLAPQCPTSPPA